ncbi:MAG TPA: DUF1801 domain-containing protein [Bacteroidia bacterium]|nr:DUF1801 domain-containing protein [Bacteroidia bacterium]
MAKAKAKTVETTNSVSDFINSVSDPVKRADSFRIVEIMKQQSGFEPKMWGPAIIGFGSYHYKYESGHEGDAPLAGFSPRKQAIALYFGLSADERSKLLKIFGKHKMSKACIYIKRLDDVSIPVLKKMTAYSVKRMKNKYK